MKHYMLDTHVHTSETSPCGVVDAKKLVHLYKDAGYDGVVITDHYYDGYFKSLGDMSWKEKISRYLQGYRNAYEEGGKNGFNVLLGMEIRFEENINDYLVFGIDEDFLESNEKLYKYGLRDFKKLAGENGILIYQAHPGRKGMSFADPAYLDGVEVYNGNPRHDSHNHEALHFARENKLKTSSGSDFHQVEDLARGGVVISQMPQDSKEFARILKENKVISLLSADS